MIKFRGIPVIDEDDMKRFDSNYDGTFVYGHYVKAFPECDYIVGDIIDDGEDFICPEWWVPVDPKTVGQFTGMKDMNGKEIYEGDVVKVVYQYWGQLGNRYEVKFKQGAFCVKYGLLSEISQSTLVIGNVHENPELLEANNE